MKPEIESEVGDVEGHSGMTRHVTNCNFADQTNTQRREAAPGARSHCLHTTLTVNKAMSGTATLRDCVITRSSSRCKVTLSTHYTHSKQGYVRYRDLGRMRHNLKSFNENHRLLVLYCSKKHT
ncbi:hypothetical protein ElyMa_005199000 [Elysia marginata]|uniref:Uncharacterized protein n=1 Tax=Elysia marginata TaxID=1093978 RepID=A0AAV4JW92_9GAST|nr:hypothetical protein ElyMa_005199000 [Elysia marginata]